MALRFAAPLHASPHRPPCAAARRAIQCSTCNLSTKLNRAAVNSKDSQNQFQHNLIVNSPSMLTKNPKLIRPVAVKSAFVLSSPIVSPTDHWGTWTVLFATAAFGYWSENTKIGSALSGPLVATLVGLAASNLGIIASEAKAYSVVLEYLLPLAVPLLLFRADIRGVIQSTGKLLLAFLIGSVATTVGTAVAFFLVPMRSLGQDAWKIAAALMGRHIGGDGIMDNGYKASNKLPVLQSATAIAVSFAICLFRCGGGEWEHLECHKNCT
uniref:Uncharacterized protein n=1 Tax=Opuntia streptacantha TaxID=393608 RepID=A0A7C9D0Q7_OPUST